MRRCGGTAMNLHAKLLARQAAGRPLRDRRDRLRQVRRYVPGAGRSHARPAYCRDRRPGAGAGARRASSRIGWPNDGSRRLGRRAARHGGDLAHRRCRCGRRLPGDRARGRGDRRCAGRRHACAASDRGGPACRHGQCRGGRAVRSGAGAARSRAGRGLQPGLWRPAGADRGAGRLGPGLRLAGDRRGQGHALPAGLPSIHAGDGLGSLRAVARARRGRRDEPQDVQLLPRRHQVGDRDGGCRQCLRPGRAARPGSPSRPAASTTCRSCCGPRGGRPARGGGHGRGGVVAGARRAAGATATCAGASTSCSRPQPTMSHAALPSTAS